MAARAEDIRTLENTRVISEESNNGLWRSMIESAIIDSKYNAFFTFKNGFEMKMGLYIFIIIVYYNS